MSNETANNQEIAQLRNDANLLLFKAEEVANIASSEEEERATEFLAQAKRRYKLVDDKRKQYVKPMKDTIDLINADFKTILEPLEQVEGIVKKGMIAYRNSEEMKKREAERLEAARRAAEAVANIKTEGLNTETVARAQEANKELAEATKDVPKVVEVQSGSASFRKDWKFEIVDSGQLPQGVTDAVLKLAFEKGLYDQVIRGMVKAGQREIQGVRIWEESIPVIRG